MYRDVVAVAKSVLRMSDRRTYRGTDVILWHNRAPRSIAR